MSRSEAEAIETELAPPFTVARPEALKVPLVDTVGAGDSFDAGFLHEYLRGSDIEACLASGNAAGARSVTRAGGTEAFRDAKHRDKFLAEHRRGGVERVAE